jgi:hypothetical protein
MSDQEHLRYARRGPDADMGKDLMLSLVSAGLFLYVGFGLGLVGVSGNPVYDGSVTALTWGARIVGVGILVTTGLSYLKVPGVLVLDFAVSVLAAGGCLAIGVIWMLYGDLQGFLLLLFGVLNGAAARTGWVRLCAARAPMADAPERDGEA